jgi:hypothetical protein
MDRSRVPASLWMTADFVVEESLRGFDERKLFVIPGWRYKLLLWALKILPDAFIRLGSIQPRNINNSLRSSFRFRMPRSARARPRKSKANRRTIVWSVPSTAMPAAKRRIRDDRQMVQSPPGSTGTPMTVRTMWGTPIPTSSVAGPFHRRA